MNLAELRAKRAELAQQAHGIVAKADKAGVEITDEEAEQIASIETEIGGIDAEIATAEARAKVATRARALAAPAGRRLPPSDGPVASGIQVREGFLDDPKRGYRSSREFFLEVLEVTTGRKAASPQFRYLAAAGSDEQGGYSDAYGGVLVPQGFSPNMLSVQAESDPTAGRTTVIPMATPKVAIPARTDKTHTSSVTGGLRWYRRAEADTVTSSRMQMEAVGLEATSLMGISFATEELIQDSPISVVALLEAGFRDEYGATILNEKLHGNGVGSYLGVIAAPGTVAVTRGSATTVVAADVLAMRSRCWGYGNAIWIANHDLLPTLAGIHVAGTNGDVFLFSPARGEDVPDMLMGRPIFFSEFAQTKGTVGDLILGNWSQYLEGQYAPLNGAESIHVRFVNNERAFRFTARNDGRPWWKSALTPKKSTVTLSPFVVIAT